MMKKTLLAGVIGLFLSANCLAQNELQNYNWEIGVDALSLLDRNEYPAFSIFVLRDLEKDWAFRGRLGFEGSSDYNADAPPGNYPVPDNHQSRSFFGSVGLQRKVLKDGPNVYVGLDLGFIRHRKERQLLEYTSWSNSMYYEERDSRRVFQISPLVGYGMPLFERLTLRIETAFVWTREKQRYQMDTYRAMEFRANQPFIPPTFRTPTETVTDARNLNRHTFMPFSQILLTFKL